MAVDFVMSGEQSNYLSQNNPSRSFIGGDMKFYLISLSSGEILFFPNMSSLPKKNYIFIAAHNCPISNIIVSEDQK